MKTARIIASLIDRNVSEFYQDAKTFAQFQARNLALWKRAEVLRVVDKVQSIFSLR